MTRTRTRSLREGSHAPEAPAHRGEKKVSPKQRDFLLVLLDERDVEPALVDGMIKALRISEDPEEFGMSMREASEAITWLKERPRKATAPKAGSDLPDVPAGHYAVTGEDGTTDFYRVDRPDSGKWAGWTFVKLQLSDEYERLSQRNTRAILDKIVEAGPREAAIRYGREIGRCSVCNRTLTNPESIEAGIGPVCAQGRGWWS